MADDESEHAATSPYSVTTTPADSSDQVSLVICNRCLVTLEGCFAYIAQKLEEDRFASSQRETEIHSSWDTFANSLIVGCRLCWALWRGIRTSPFENFEERRRQAETTGAEASTRSSPASSFSSTASVSSSNVYINVKKGLAPGRKGAHWLVVCRKRSCGADCSANLIRNWISECERSHEDCTARQARATQLGLSGKAPTRLVDLTRPGVWSIVNTAVFGTTIPQGKPNTPRYAALSHRWKEVTPKLQRANVERFGTQPQPDAMLPREYRHVIDLCRAVGLPYLWIDSLCIVQDCGEDLLREIGSMGSVYTNATLTCMVCWSDPKDTADGPGNGFLHPRAAADTYIPYGRLYPDDNEGDFFYEVSDKVEWEHAVTAAPILQRGWVSQERLLSHRILYLGNDQLYWECDGSQTCESRPIGRRFPGNLDDRYCGQTSLLSLRTPSNENRDDFDEEDDLIRLWWGVVSRYSATALSFEQDRLVALSALARIGAMQNGVGNDEYLAGCWRRSLLADLLWVTNAPAKSIQGQVLAPSWSWAASQSGLHWAIGVSRPGMEDMTAFRDPNHVPLAALVDTSLITNGDAFGSVKGGGIDLACLLIPLTCTVLDAPGTSSYLTDTTLSFFLEHSCSGTRVSIDRLVSFSDAYRPSAPCFLLPLIADCPADAGMHPCRGILVQPKEAEEIASETASFHEQAHSGDTKLVRIGVVEETRFHPERKERELYRYPGDPLKQLVLNTFLEKLKQQIPPESNWGSECEETNIEGCEAAFARRLYNHLTSVYLPGRRPLGGGNGGWDEDPFEGRAQYKNGADVFGRGVFDAFGEGRFRIDDQPVTGFYDESLKAMWTTATLV